VNIFKTGGIVISIFMIIAGIIMINMPKQYFIILKIIEDELKILQNNNIKYLEKILKSIKEVHQNYIVCDDCLGTGFQRDTSPVDCFMCNQQGKVSLQQGFFNVQQSCPMCLGDGKLYKDVCKICDGQGYFKKENSQGVSIVDQLKEIVTLRENGSLSEEVFHQLREQIITQKFHS
jgi:DnaJ-class molecular chaperone